MPTILGREAGYDGVLVSLGGIRGKAGQGRECRNFSNITCPAATYISILEANPKRLAASLYNSGANEVYLHFGDDMAFSGYGQTLGVNETFWINQDFAWTGGVRACSVAGTTIRGTEVSIP